MSQLPNFTPFPGPFMTTIATPCDPVNPYGDFYVWVNYPDGSWGVCSKAYTEIAQFENPPGALAFDDIEGSLPEWARKSNSILNGLSYPTQDEAWGAAQRTLGGWQVLGTDWRSDPAHNLQSPWAGRIPSSNFPPRTPSSNPGTTPSPWFPGPNPCGDD